MKINFSKQRYESVQADLLVVPVVAGDARFLTELDKKLGGTLKNELARTGYDAELGATLWVNASSNIKAEKMCLLGLGDKAEITAESYRRMAGSVVGKANAASARTVALVAPEDGNAKNMIAAIAEGLWLADYKFLDYKKEEARKAKHKAIREVIILYDGALAQARQAMAGAAAGVLGAIYARDLVNQPSNVIHPRDLAASAKNITGQSERITLELLGRPALAEKRFGALLAVAQGSDEEPYLIHLTYASPKPLKRVALVGKGITFDSGGLSLKPSDAMTEMKVDMAGGAIVLGLFRALMLLDLPLEIHGLIPACENMPGGGATKPGDIVTSASGKTIEIANTDAEGRLILADTLAFASRTIKPDILLDVATLTGAAMVALGEDIAALMTTDDKLAASLRTASENTGEGLWRLPQPKEYLEKYHSDVADIKNVHDDKWGGAIMGGIFLQEFVDAGIPFAHIDVAGPVWSKKGNRTYNPKGATGYGVRMLLEWLKALT